MSTATTTCTTTEVVLGAHITGGGPTGLRLFSTSTDAYPGYTVNTTAITPSETVCVEVSNASGGGGASYIIDVGSTVLLGGILMFFVAYWIVGLTRHKKTWNT